MHLFTIKYDFFYIEKSFMLDFISDFFLTETMLV